MLSANWEKSLLNLARESFFIPFKIFLVTVEFINNTCFYVQQLFATHNIITM